MENILQMLTKESDQNITKHYTQQTWNNLTNCANVVNVSLERVITTYLRLQLTDLSGEQVCHKTLPKPQNTPYSTF